MKTLKVLAIVGTALLATACASKKDGSGADAGQDLNGGNNGVVTGGTLGEQLRAVGDTVYFDLDSYQVRPDGAAILQQQAQLLNANPEVMVRIEGHADERGTREYNISLSARRATTTRNFLLSQGVPGSRISSIAYGKERPAALCDAEECWSQNRRTVTVVTGGAN